MRSTSEAVRRQKTQRPRRGGAKTFTIHVYGDIDIGTYVLPTKVMLDETDDYPEHKQIVAVDAVLVTGSLTMSWSSLSLGEFYAGHDVTGDGADNFVLFDGLGGRPEPFLIENASRFGEFISIEFSAGTGADLAASFTVQTTPV